jgi:16S rRNA (uracil1498-N3)-methyltransferase
MRVNRIHVEQPLHVGSQASLGEAAAGHLLRVLRAGVGDACVVFNGDGNDYDARITAIGKRNALVEVLAMRYPGNESPLRITLLQALARGEKMDLVLQKGTELGVAAIVPVTSDRSEVKLDAERVDKRVAHWRNVVIAACEQCGRARIPPVALPASFAQALPALPTASRRLLLDPDASQAVGDLALRSVDAVVLAIGPEGGWSPRDREILHAAGFEGVRLGPRILRTESAGLAAIAALQSRYGDLG